MFGNQRIILFQNKLLNTQDNDSENILCTPQIKCIVCSHNVLISRLEFLKYIPFHISEPRAGRLLSKQKNIYYIIGNGGKLQPVFQPQEISKCQLKNE